MTGYQVLGMNERNIGYIYPYNNRRDYPLADDKLVTKRVLEEANIPTPRLLKTYSYYYQIQKLYEDLKNESDFVVKPARSMGGGGIIIFRKYSEGYFHTISGEKYNRYALVQHAAMILSGVYSLDNEHDIVMVEEKISLHDDLTRLTSCGIPDIRLIMFKNEPVMAMLRLPTEKSKGRANLHAGGLGVAINLVNGRTFVNDRYQKSVKINPENGAILEDVQIPFWHQILQISEKICDVIPLVYLGIDFVIDNRFGPQVLELNVRPGLEIQNVNGRGLRDILYSIKEKK